LLSREGAVPIGRSVAIMKSFTFDKPAFIGAGAVVAFLAWALFAPPVAEAGCSHLVASWADRYESSALSESLMHDLATSSDPLPEPSRPHPCSGAFCSGQPAVPAAPAKVFDGARDSSAFLTAVPGLVVNGDSFLPAEKGAVHPTRRTIAVFHPPRSLPSA
jgi:hypothetical protein